MFRTSTFFFCKTSTNQETSSRGCRWISVPAGDFAISSSPRQPDSRSFVSCFLFPAPLPIVFFRVGPVQRWQSLSQGDVTFWFFSTRLFLKCSFIVFPQQTKRRFSFLKKVSKVKFFFSCRCILNFWTPFAEDPCVATRWKKKNKTTEDGLNQWRRLFGLVECESRPFLSFCCTVSTFQTELMMYDEMREVFKSATVPSVFASSSPSFFSPDRFITSC